MTNAEEICSKDFTAISDVKLIQINGRKVFGPPENWQGPPPTGACELFVRCIPKNMNEYKILEPFLQYGCIYEFRLPIDFNRKNRGYAYVKYTTKLEASRAMEVLNHYYIAPGHRFEITWSYEKCRLFVTNIPKDIDNTEVEDKMRTLFPKLQCVHFKPISTECNDANDHDTNNNRQFENRGYVFVQFSTHQEALESKKNITPGLVRLWERDLKVVWARYDITWNASTYTQCKTIFVRNIDLTVNQRDLMQLVLRCVPRTAIFKISKIRNTAFFEFTTHEAAEWCLSQLQSVILKGKTLQLEWAKPPKQNTVHCLFNTDFGAVLRLKCLANNWGTPIIIFGRYYNQESLQYGTIVLRNPLGDIRAIYCIMNINDLVDIHSRMCELVCTLIEVIGGFPDYNYVFLAEKDTAHFLGIVNYNAYVMEFIASHGVPKHFFLDWNEMHDLSWAVISLMHTTEDVIFDEYLKSFHMHSEYSYIHNWPLLPKHRIYGTITPKYRKKPPLNYNLTDKQIVLALCFRATGTNMLFVTQQEFAVNTFDKGLRHLSYLTMKLLPTALVQSRINLNYILQYAAYPPNLKLLSSAADVVPTVEAIN